MFPLPETITVWNSSGSDGLGGRTWAGPYVYPARIAYSQQKFTDTNGDQRLRSAMVYSEGGELRIGSMVVFLESAAINPPAEADDVRAIVQIPSGAGALKKAWFE